MSKNQQNQNVLFACSEMTPLIKTGGLADVCGSLPHALQRAGNKIKVVLPGYQSVLQQLDKPSFLCMLELPLGPAAICQTEVEGIDILLVCHPSFSNRGGNPYMSDDDRGWPDNPRRYALYSQAVVKMAMDTTILDWSTDIVHCHDWQTGLIPALLALQTPRPATVFTIHNLAYQGNIMHNVYNELELPAALFHPNGLEFWGQASYIKGGLAYADRVNTVSAGYASEIKTAEFGNGMDGLLRSRADRVSGILNGIDEKDWDPQTDSHLPTHYSVKNLGDKAQNKSALQKRMGLAETPKTLLLGVISRLAEQKGIDIIIDAISHSIANDIQLVVLGAGESKLQEKLQALENKHPEKVAIHIGFDESLSRLIEAGADVFLMPSRYEPCGLNQMYSLRYGTLPLVTRVGGLADTVINYDGNNIDTANGFVINAATSKDLCDGINRALECYQDSTAWRALQTNGMQASFSWDESALRYGELYTMALQDAFAVNEQMALWKTQKIGIV